MKFMIVACIPLWLLLTGCSVKHYAQKPILYGADSIPVTSVSPSSCKYVGDVQGNDGTDIKDSPGRKGEVRQGALNNLRNNAFGVASKLTQPVIYITQEEANCVGFGIYPCDPKTISGGSSVQNYIIKGQIFECGVAPTKP